MADQQKSPRTSLDTVIVFTSRMKELAEFYGQGLGIGPYQESPKHLGCIVGSVYFGFDQVDAGSDKSRNGPGPTVWFTVEDIEDSFRRLVELGAIVRYPPTKKPWGAVLSSFEDLDGNIFGISQRLESTDE